MKKALLFLGLALCFTSSSLASCKVSCENGAHEHEFTTYVSNGDATETKDGTKTAKCTGCDETNTITDVGSATGTKELKYELNNGEYSVKGIEESFAGSEVYIPMYYENKKVTSISQQAFMSNEKICKLTITGNVQTIGSYAFGACENLTSVTFSDGLKSIEDNAFCYCGFGELSIPDTVTSIGNRAFGGCNELLKVKLSNSITELSEELFQDCGRLVDITIPQSVTTIKSCAFQDCGLISIRIPKNVTTIENYAFTYCSKLVEVINESSLSIGEGDRELFGRLNTYALNVKTSGDSDIVKRGNFSFFTHESTNYLLNYDGRDTEITLPESFNGEKYEIYTVAFKDCKKLKNITISDNATSIRSQAFSDCSALENVKIGKGVKSIEDNAFCYCDSLTSVVIPSNVETMEFSIFNDCENLKNIYCEAASKPAGWRDDWSNRCNATVTWGYTE